MLAGEVGPVDIEENEFGVRGTATGEFEPLLGPGPHQQIGVRQTGRVETRGQRGLVDAVGGARPSRDLARQLAGRVRDLGAPTVVQGEVQDYRRVGLGLAGELGERPSGARRDQCEIARHPEPHAILDGVSDSAITA